MSKVTMVTEEGLQALKDELDYLKLKRRPEVNEMLAQAKAFGDLSENSEYEEAKNEQGKVQSRIFELEEMLNHVQIIASPSTESGVSLGHKVKIQKTTADGKTTEHEYTIVGTTESSPLENKISNESPIGKALLGLTVGEVTTCDTLKGKLTLKVLEIF